MAQDSSDGTITTAASATTTRLTARFSTAGSGVTRPSASASFKDIGVVFENSQALRDLIGPGASFAELLLNFDVSYSLQTNPIPGLFAQSLAFLDINLVASSAGDFRGLTDAEASITNGPSSHTFGNTGFLSGLPENGGTASATLPIRVTASVPGAGLSVLFTAFANVDGLALQRGFANGDVTVDLPSLPLFVTTLGGVPVSTLGVEYRLVPQLAGVAPPVPEPSTWALFGAGMLALFAARHGRQLSLRRNESAA